MKQHGMIPPVPSAQRVFVAYLGDEAKAEAVKLTAELRQGGIAVVSNLGDRSLKAQLRQANALGAAYALIIGEDEVREGTAVLRNMEKGEQRKVPAHEVLGLLRNPDASFEK